jgi:hypothetical protein
MTKKSLAEIVRRAHAQSVSQSVDESQIDRILALSNNDVTEADIDAEIAHAISSPQHTIALKLALQSRVAANELANAVARLSRRNANKSATANPTLGANVVVKINRFRLAWALPAIALALVLGFMHKPMSPSIHSAQIEIKPDIIGVMASSFEGNGPSSVTQTKAAQSDTLFVGDFDS